jgi:hypothetical protein
VQEPSQLLPQEQVQEKGSNLAGSDSLTVLFAIAYAFPLRGCFCAIVVSPNKATAKIVTNMFFINVTFQKAGVRDFVLKLNSLAAG